MHKEEVPMRQVQEWVRGEMMPQVQTEQATVYRGGGRRWFTKRAAARAEAAKLYRKKYPCTCEKADYSGHYPGYACDNHTDHRERFVRRVMKWVLGVK
jgi:hypothetical protein